MRILRSGSLAILLVVSLSACVSYSYVDKHGQRHVLGFVDMTVGSEAIAARSAEIHVVKLEQVGLAITRPPGAGPRLMVGFGAETFVTASNDVCLDAVSPASCPDQLRGDKR